jgi:hypothetical protein
MDKQGNIWTPEEVQQRLGELTGAKDMDRKIEAVRRKAQASSVSSEEIQQIQGVLSRPVKKDVSQKKVTLSEYLSSPEVQRKRKIESEREQRAVFEKQMAFRSAQEQNPIRGRPRRKRKRGRKAR